MTIKHPIQAVVDHLGTMTPGEIRTYLIEHGHKGEPFRSDRCPIANYLHAHCPIAEIHVGPIYIGVFHGGNRMALPVSTPASVATFMAYFDSGAYPELVSESEVF